MATVLAALIAGTLWAFPFVLSLLIASKSIDFGNTARLTELSLSFLGGLLGVLVSVVLTMFTIRHSESLAALGRERDRYDTLYTAWLDFREWLSAHIDVMAEQRKFLVTLRNEIHQNETDASSVQSQLSEFRRLARVTADDLKSAFERNENRLNIYTQHEARLFLSNTLINEKVFSFAKSVNSKFQYLYNLPDAFNPEGASQKRLIETVTEMTTSTDIHTTSCRMFLKTADRQIAILRDRLKYSA
jgi:hypothetical protein